MGNSNNFSVEGQGGRSVRVKGTNGVGKGPNDELAQNSDQHPDRHTKGTGSSTVGLGKILMMGNEGGQARKGFSIIKIKEGDLAKLPPLRIIGITTRGKATVIIVANDSVKGQGGRSVRVKGTNGVGKGPNDELALNSDQHPDPHTRGTGISTVGLGKMQGKTFQIVLYGH
ncbi:hypothetical protein CMV_002302 [Castanea mollissima]|uniref:Uncharacterized protein n=1 Tax=Castanea mollissima TaxID=60419 RepID=A0A8J4RTU3_9ROSI|nr:hypothetical protein CMV_002302 [Castanea mollissima]